MLTLFLEPRFDAGLGVLRTHRTTVDIQPFR